MVWPVNIVCPKLKKVMAQWLHQSHQCLCYGVQTVTSQFLSDQVQLTHLISSYIFEKNLLGHPTTDLVVNGTERFHSSDKGNDIWHDNMTFRHLDSFISFTFFASWLWDWIKSPVVALRQSRLHPPIGNLGTKCSHGCLAIILYYTSPTDRGPNISALSLATAWSHPELFQEALWPLPTESSQNSKSWYLGDYSSDRKVYLVIWG